MMNPLQRGAPFGHLIRLCLTSPLQYDILYLSTVFVCSVAAMNQEVIMSLIQCSECGNEVSSKAENCPRCGCPIRSKPDLVSGRRVQTVERTAKRYKGLIVLFTLILCVAVVWIVASVSASPKGELAVAPIVIGILALGGFILTRVVAWWHHG